MGAAIGFPPSRFCPLSHLFPYGGRVVPPGRGRSRRSGPSIESIGQAALPFQSWQLSFLCVSCLWEEKPRTIPGIHSHVDTRQFVALLFLLQSIDRFQSSVSQCLHFSSFTLHRPFLRVLQSTAPPFESSFFELRSSAGRSACAFLYSFPRLSHPARKLALFDILPAEGGRKWRGELDCKRSRNASQKLFVDTIFFCVAFPPILKENSRSIKKCSRNTTESPPRLSSMRPAKPCGSHADPAPANAATRSSSG